MHREQWNRGRRWMHHGASAVVHDRVILILSLERVALIRSAFLAAIEIAGTEIPAPRPLHQVPAKRRHVADLRRGCMACSIRKCRIAPSYLRMLRNLMQRSERAELQTAIGRLDAVQRLHVQDA